MERDRRAYLILENGSVFKGVLFGAHKDATGELVFSTGMTGFPEVLTDSAYTGQILLQTFPISGNYGVIPSDFESCSVKAAGYIVKEWCPEPSNFRSEGRLDDFLSAQGIPGLCGIDTRALTALLRENGAMNAAITMSEPTPDDLARIRLYRVGAAVERVSVKAVEKYGSGSVRVALIDYGVRKSVINELVERGCEVLVFPHDTPSSAILEASPGGIMLSEGPGDPAEPSNIPLVETIRELTASGVPLFGVGLGHQLLALSLGLKTTKLTHGHRGANQPVKCTDSGRVYITSQNHGYAVLPGDTAKTTFVNVNDGTCEGLEHSPVVFSVQFDPLVSGGTAELISPYNRFIKSAEEYLKCR